MTNVAINTARATAAVFPSAEYFAQLQVTERVGVILRRDEYTVPRRSPVHSHLVPNNDMRRVSFMVRLDGGIGSEIVTIDQTLDATAAVLQKGDQVVAAIIDDVHIESTVREVFPYAARSSVSDNDVANGDVLRTGEFLDNNGVPVIASLVLAARGSNGRRDLVIDVQKK